MRLAAGSSARVPKGRTWGQAGRQTRAALDAAALSTASPALRVQWRSGCKPQSGKGHHHPNVRRCRERGCRPLHPLLLLEFADAAQKMYFHDMVCAGNDYAANCARLVLELFVGIVQSAVCLFMASAVAYIIQFERTFNVTKWLVIVTCLSSAVGIFFASLDVFGTYFCNKGKQLWKCPDVTDPDKFTPGFVGYYGGDALRTALSVSAFLLTLACVAKVRCTGNATDAKEKDLIYQALAKKTILYPFVQSFCRLPAIYVFFHSSVASVDTDDHEQGLSGSKADSHLQLRLFAFYTMVAITPMGGLLSLAVFLHVNKGARELNSRLWQMCQCKTADRPEEWPKKEKQQQLQKLATIAAPEAEQPEPESLPVPDAMDEDELVLRVVLLSSRPEGGGAAGQAGGDDGGGLARLSLPSEVYVANPMVSVDVRYKTRLTTVLA